MRVAFLVGLALATAGLPAATVEARTPAEAATREAMSDAAFWAIIDRTIVHAGDQEAQMAALRAELEPLDADTIAAFMQAFDRQMDRAYSWDLWGAGYVAHGGLSDDGFAYFRRWAISLGRTRFERLLAKPDDLASVAPPGDQPLEFEDFNYVAIEVWTEKTGADGPPFATGWDGMATQPSGEPFAENSAALARRYPLTWARFGKRPLG